MVINIPVFSMLSRTSPFILEFHGQLEALLLVIQEYPGLLLREMYNHHWEGAMEAWQQGKKELSQKLEESHRKRVS